MRSFAKAAYFKDLADLLGTQKALNDRQNKCLGLFFLCLWHNKQKLDPSVFAQYRPEERERLEAQLMSPSGDAAHVDNFHAMACAITARLGLKAKPITADDLRSVVILFKSDVKKGVKDVNQARLEALLASRRVTLSQFKGAMFDSVLTKEERELLLKHLRLAKEATRVKAPRKRKPRAPRPGAATKRPTRASGTRRAAAPSEGKAAAKEEDEDEESDEIEEEEEDEEEEDVSDSELHAVKSMGAGVSGPGAAPSLAATLPMLPLAGEAAAAAAGDNLLDDAQSAQLVEAAFSEASALFPHDDNAIGGSVMATIIRGGARAAPAPDAAAAAGSDGELRAALSFAPSLTGALLLDAHPGLRAALSAAKSNDNALFKGRCPPDKTAIEAPATHPAFTAAPAACDAPLAATASAMAFADAALGGLAPAPSATGITVSLAQQASAFVASGAFAPALARAPSAGHAARLNRIGTLLAANIAIDAAATTEEALPHLQSVFGPDVTVDMFVAAAEEQDEEQDGGAPLAPNELEELSALLEHVLSVK